MGIVKKYGSTRRLLGSFLALITFVYTPILAQIGLLPTNSYYRNQAFQLDVSKDSNSGGFNLMNSGYTFPILLNPQDFRIAIVGEKKQRNWIGRKLYDEHFLEFRDSNYFFNVDFLADLSFLRDFESENNASNYINTRGIQVQGGIGEYFGFYSTLFENQAFFFEYQNEEIKKGGAVVTNQAGVQNQSGGFVSGGNRTKPFKDGGFDYAMAFGGMIFKPTKYLSFIAGNSPLFIGAGHRSLIYSDHSGMAANLRTKWEIAPWINAEWIYGQHWNLIRMNANTIGTERLHEKKGFSLKTINFSFGKSIQLSLFESSNWLQYENDELRRLSGWFYNPIPGLNPMALGLQGDRVHTVLGSQLVAKVFKKLYLYSQLTVNSFKRDHLSYQLGARTAQPFGIKNLHALIEFNQLPNNAYKHQNVRLNYSNNNVAIAHPLGTGLTEFIGQIHYTYKRFGVNSQINLIQTVRDVDENANGISLAPIDRANPSYSETTILFGQMDLFYRFNPLTDMQIFVSAMFRNQIFDGQNLNGTFLSFGFRTALNNRYFDL